MAHRDLPEHAVAELHRLQSIVAGETSFNDRSSKAKSLWGSCKGTATGKPAFDTIKASLLELSVFVGLCNYCEQNEGNDIEHIFPKSNFPEFAFVWENYLLACPKCNSTHKSDKIDVLDEDDEVRQVPRNTEPVSKRVAFINPRIEDPADFMILNPTTYHFDVLPGLSKAQAGKANQTLAILQLNIREPLIAARRAAAGTIYDILDRLNRLLKATTPEEFLAEVNPADDSYDANLTLEELKDEAKRRVRQRLARYQHPSVWQGLKKFSKVLGGKWETIFTAIPEALTW